MMCIQSRKGIESMKSVAYFECEICGERFEYDEDCQVHEFRHLLEGVFTSGAKFYDMNGIPIALSDYTGLEDFIYVVHGIDCPSVAVADKIQEIWDEVGYSAPFDEIGTVAAPCRVMYNPKTYTWFNADEALTSIKKQFGEK